MTALFEDTLHSVVSIDVIFAGDHPGFGDLFEITGATHPRFAPAGRFRFGSLADLHFSQVDDYFGVRSLADEGDDVAVWLYPLLGGKPVHHHPGPFEGVRLEFNVLRNPERFATHYLHCIERFAALGYACYYVNRNTSLGQPPFLSEVRADIDATVRHWRNAGIIVGSDAALDIER